MRVLWTRRTPLVWYSMVEVCEGAPVAVSGWVPCMCILFIHLNGFIYWSLKQQFNTRNAMQVMQVQVQLQIGTVS